MGWELALIASIICVPFFLVYVSGKIDSDHWFPKLLKLFLILMAFTYLITLSGTPIYLLDANYQTVTTQNCTDALTNSTSCTSTVTMNDTAFVKLKGNISASVQSTTLMFRLIMYAFIFGFIIYTLESAMNWVKNWKRGNNA